MILDEADYERFDHLSPAELEQESEQYRIAPADSTAGTRREVQAVMGSICQEVYSASWIANFEAEVWQMLHEDPPPAVGVYNTGVLAAAGDLALLRSLTIDAGWWPLFDHPDPDRYRIGRAVSIDEARTRYARP